MRPGASGSGAGQCGLHLVDDRLERLRLADRKLGQNLAVDLDAGFGKPVDEARIGQPEFAHRRIEALNPKRAEDALLRLAVACRILHRAIDGGFRGADRILATAVEALRLLQCLLVLGVRCDAAFDASHEKSPEIRKVGRQSFGRKYFFTLSPSLLNSTAV